MLGLVPHSQNYRGGVGTGVVSSSSGGGSLGSLSSMNASNSASNSGSSNNNPSGEGGDGVLGVLRYAGRHLFMRGRKSLVGTVGAFFLLCIIGSQLWGLLSVSTSGEPVLLERRRPLTQQRSHLHKQQSAYNSLHGAHANYDNNDDTIDDNSDYFGNGAGSLDITPVVTIWTVLPDVDQHSLSSQSRVRWLDSIHTANTIQAWHRLPQTQVLLFGSTGACALAATLAPSPDRHRCYALPCINPTHLAPTMDCLFKNASALARTEFVMYSNPATIYFGDLIEAIRSVDRMYQEVLLVGSAVNLPHPQLINFKDHTWSADLHYKATAFGASAHQSGHKIMHYFVYRRALTPSMPVLLHGHPFWENWILTSYIGNSKAASIDASAVVLAVTFEDGQARASEGGTEWNKALVQAKTSKLLVNPVNAGRLENADFRLVGSLPTKSFGGVNTGGLTKLSSPPRPSCPRCQTVRNRQPMEVTLFKAAINRKVIVASVNYGYLDFAMNWLCSLQHIGVGNYVFHAMDRPVYDALFNLGMPVIFYEAEEAKQYIRGGEHNADEIDDENGAAYGTIAYQALMNSRTEMIYTIIQTGYDVLLCDVDIVILRDPFKFFDNKHDLLGGAHKDTKVTGGFLFLRSNERMRKIWFAVLERHRNVLRAIQKDPNFDPHENTEQEILNKILVNSSDTDILWSRIPSDVIVDGNAFFIERSVQKKGVWPAAIHNNYIIGKQNKYERFVNVSLWFVDENFKCTAFPGLLPSPPKSMPKLTIKIIAFDRPDSLKRLLVSLHKTDFLGDRVHLEIYIDKPAPLADGTEVVEEKQVESVRIAQSFLWPHGDKLVIVRQEHYGLKEQWLNIWFPASNDEIAMIIEDDNAVSPVFYKFLKQTLQRYFSSTSEPGTFDPRIFGIMLQNQHFIPGRYPTPPSELLSPSVSYYRFQQLSTWGPVFFPSHWASFIAWTNARSEDQSFRPLFSNMKTNEWYLTRNGGQSVWSAYFMRFAAERGLYAIYTNFHDNAGLVVNYRDKGVNFNEDKGVNSPMLESLDRIAKLPPSPFDMPLYDFHFNLIEDDPSILELRGLYSDTFNVFTH